MKKEIFIKTYIFRKNRTFSIIFIYAISIFWAFYFGPILLDIILPDILKTFYDLYKPLVILLIEYIFTFLFLMTVIYPFYLLYKRSEIGHNEILIASPVKPGDIFIGEFLGMLPFHLLSVLLIGPIITSLIMQIIVLNLLDFLIIYSCIFLLLISGFLVGSFLANITEYYILKNKFSLTINEIILLLLSFIIVIIFYFFHYLFSTMIKHPEIKNLLIFYPSFWYSNIIISIIDPYFLCINEINIWVSIILAIIFPLLIFYLSYHAYNRIHTIEIGNYLVHEIIEKEHKIYQLIRKIIIIKKWQDLIIIQFKEIFRRKQNLIKIFYVLTFTGVSGIILSTSSMEIQHIIGKEVLYINELIGLVLSWMGGLIFGLLLGSNDFLVSEELLYLYKRSPLGLKTIVIIYLTTMFYIILFLDVILTIFFVCIFNWELAIIFPFFVMFIINSVIFLLQAIGYQCLNPKFDERNKEFLFNLYLIICLQVISLFISISIIIPYIPYSTDYSLGIVLILLINSIISLGVAVLLSCLGFRQLLYFEL